MAKERNRPYATSKKHLARQQREQLQRRYILIGTIVVLSFVVIVLLFGYINSTIIQPAQPVAIVNSEEISTGDWQTQTKYYRYSLIRNIDNTLQLAQLFGNDPNTLATVANQIVQIESQLDPSLAGQTTLNQMIDDVIIRQEAQRRGITISEAEIDEQFAAAFGYFPSGTSTPTVTLVPIPTSTLSELQRSLIPSPSPSATPENNPTATPEATPTTVLSTPTAASEPTASPTPFTEEGYKNLVEDTLSSIEQNFNITADEIERGLRYTLTADAYRNRLSEELTKDIATEELQVWARHILVNDEETANTVLSRLEEGEDFCALAAEYSQDTSNKDTCGDLDWFGPGMMVAEFETAAYDLEIGEISSPVETQFGWHIIQSLGKEERSLSSSELQQRKQNAFQDWLTGAQESSEIEINENWEDRVVEEPTIPLQLQLVIQQFIQQAQSGQNNLLQPTP